MLFQEQFGNKHVPRRVTGHHVPVHVMGEIRLIGFCLSVIHCLICPVTVDHCECRNIVIQVISVMQRETKKIQ